MNNKGYFLSIHDTNNQIVGLVGVTFKICSVYSDDLNIIEPLFLCTSNKYRNSGLTRVLSDKVIYITKTEEEFKDYDCGLFVTNKAVINPSGRIRGYQRILNYKHLVKNNFIMTPDQDIKKTHDRYKIILRPDENYVKAEKTEENIKKVYELYCNHSKAYSLHHKMTLKEIENYLFNQNYVTTILVKNENEIVDFISYNYYDIHNEETDNTIKVANILMYSSNKTRSDILFVNALKHISLDKYHIVNVNNMMSTNEFIYSNIRNSDIDSDNEDIDTVHEYHLTRTSKTRFINFYGWQTEQLKQNQISWLLI
jgi:hypothetical protein